MAEISGGPDSQRISQEVEAVIKRIEDKKKMFYYRGLAEWDNEKGWLTDTCLDGQDTFKLLLAALGIERQ